MLSLLDEIFLEDESAVRVGGDNDQCCICTWNTLELVDATSSQVNIEIFSLPVWVNLSLSSFRRARYLAKNERTSPMMNIRRGSKYVFATNWVDLYVETNSDYSGSIRR